jgi:anion-transporting  ArsA/GET3 family ATPase
MDELLDHSLLFVTGKGGVGKSTVAAVLALAAARRGLRVIVAEVAARGDIPRALGISHALPAYRERVVRDRVNHISIDPQRALEEYLRQQLPVGPMAGMFSRSRLLSTFTAATPGLREMLTIGKAWELAQPRRRTRRATAYDLVVLDAPATGHAVAMLEAPRTFAAVARVGPVATQGRAVAGFLRDARSTAIVAVTTAEEMPVAETLELRERVRGELGLELATVVVNGSVADRFSDRDERPLLAAPPSPARNAALFMATWAHRQRAQIAALRRGIAGIPLVTLPLIFETSLGADALELLAGSFER